MYVERTTCSEGEVKSYLDYPDGTGHMARKICHWFVIGSSHNQATRVS